MSFFLSVCTGKHYFVSYATTRDSKCLFVEQNDVLACGTY